ncbi:hypothetical protein AMTRI_Chr11g156860 [Amborella trichopoda]
MLSSRSSCWILPFNLSRRRNSPGFSLSLSTTSYPFNPARRRKPHLLPLSLSTPCRAAKQQSGSRKRSRNGYGKKSSGNSPPTVVDNDENAPGRSPSPPMSLPNHPMPKPPAGFILDGDGKVVLASSRRLATIVDSANGQPLECVIRRVFKSSQGDECMLLCPVDTPVQILKSANPDGWAAVSDNEIDAILPTAAYALAKIHMHLVLSGFCYTARGAFCYSEEDILEFRTGNSFDGTQYMIYTPSDPLLFFAVKDSNGQLKIAEDDLLEDPAIIGALDEETEFNALVEEEAALLESLLTER